MLGDPHYLRKANALYYEFGEVGLNKQLGYGSPADLVDLYPQLYFDSISAHLKTAIHISMSHRAGGNGSQTYTATSSVLNTITDYRGRSVGHKFSEERTYGN